MKRFLCTIPPLRESIQKRKFYPCLYFAWELNTTERCAILTSFFDMSLVLFWQCCTTSCCVYRTSSKLKYRRWGRVFPSAFLFSAFIYQSDFLALRCLAFRICNEVSTNNKGGGLCVRGIIFWIVWYPAFHNPPTSETCRENCGNLWRCFLAANECQNFHNLRRDMGLFCVLVSVLLAGGKIVFVCGLLSA